MKIRSFVCTSALTALASLLWSTAAIAIDYPQREGLVAIATDSLDQAWMRPGVDLSRYDKVLLEPVTLSFKSDWRRKMNLSERSLSRQLSNRDIARIDEQTRKDFDRVFAEQLVQAGYQIVSSAGPDVLVLKPAITELYLNDPGVQSVGRSDVYVTNAGQATLTIEARDGASGALLGATIDHRETRDHNIIRRSSSVFTQSDLRELFADWGRIIATDLHELHERPALSQVD